MDQDPLEFLENSTYKNEWKESNYSIKKKNLGNYNFVVL